MGMSRSAQPTDFRNPQAINRPPIGTQPQVLPQAGQTPYRQPTDMQPLPQAGLPPQANQMASDATAMPRGQGFLPPQANQQAVDRVAMAMANQFRAPEQMAAANPVGAPPQRRIITPEQMAAMQQMQRR